MISKRLSVVLIGMASVFLVALLRPLIIGLLRSGGAANLASTNPLIFTIMYFLIGAVIMEGIRYLAKKFLFKDSQSIIEPLVIGGSAGTYQLVSNLAYLKGSGADSSIILYATLIEFASTLMFMALALFIWRGFDKNKGVLALLAAILIHTAVKSTIDYTIIEPNLYYVGAIVLALSTAISLFYIMSNIRNKNQPKHTG